ncbi:hypothetical protein BFJ65_g18614 [Fusarium oxysporum f. sp. cepae]|uniref:Uncharacterized protein n=1 Tax=Fusarium oxysporum f. sp. cepae TaxID=396571 RepID=A0A3L6MNS1_FUSOX|nr:hypothetical protein BFJ65_g18614 [Fusarium oxysporum f. sp. cepae]
MTIEDLCRGYPPDFCDGLRYTRGLDFEQEPDYDSLRGRLLQALKGSNGLTEDEDMTDLNWSDHPFLTTQDWPPGGDIIFYDAEAQATSTQIYNFVSVSMSQHRRCQSRERMNHKADALGLGVPSDGVSIRGSAPGTDKLEGALEMNPRQRRRPRREYERTTYYGPSLPAGYRA